MNSLTIFGVIAIAQSANKPSRIFFKVGPYDQPEIDHVKRDNYIPQFNREIANRHKLHDSP